MTLLLPFDYVFMRSLRVYGRSKKTRVPWIYALCVITNCQYFNILNLVFLSRLIPGWKINVSKAQGFGLFLVILSLNYSRYVLNEARSTIECKWAGEESRERHLHGILVVVYIVLSFALFFGVAGFIRIA